MRPSEQGMCIRGLFEEERSEDRVVSVFLIYPPRSSYMRCPSEVPRAIHLDMIGPREMMHLLGPACCSMQTVPSYNSAGRIIGLIPDPSVVAAFQSTGLVGTNIC